MTTAQKLAELDARETKIRNDKRTAAPIRRFAKMALAQIAREREELTAQLDAEEDKPIGSCPHCGDSFYFEGEARMHLDYADCIGGNEQFDTREEARGAW